MFRRWRAQSDAHDAEGFFERFFSVQVFLVETSVMSSVPKSRPAAQGTSDQGRKQRPVWSRRGFPLNVAVFEFPSSSDEAPPNFSVKLTRTFRRDENSAWETSEYLGGGDLLRGAKLLEAADGFIQSRLEAHFRSRQDQRDGGEGF
jgi:hypothetical protein